MTMGNHLFRHAQSVRCSSVGSTASTPPCFLKPRNDTTIAIGNNGSFPPCNKDFFRHAENNRLYCLKMQNQQKFGQARPV